MVDAPKTYGDPANLRILRYLVLAMTIVFIVGFSIVVVLVYLQFVKARNGFEGSFPDYIELPEGTKAQSFTKGRGWYAIVTQDDKILIFDSTSGELAKSVDIR